MAVHCLIHPSPCPCVMSFLFCSQRFLLHHHTRGCIFVTVARPPSNLLTILQTPSPSANTYAQSTQKMMAENVEETIDLIKAFPRTYSSHRMSSSDLDASALSRIARPSAVSCIFALIAWHYPRSLVQKESSIASKVPPYQQTQAGDVILDFELNQPLVDPSTIPCKVICSLPNPLPYFLRTRLKQALFVGFMTLVQPVF